ncbi:hypothetical protein D3C84_1015910 [compost metagenome]
MVEVGAAVDHALFIDRDAGGGAFELGQAFGDVEFVEGGLGFDDSGRIVRSYDAGFASGFAASAVEFVHGSFSGMAGVGAFGGFGCVFFVEFVPAQHGDEAPAQGHAEVTN